MPSAPWPDEEPKSLRSPCYGLAVYKNQTLLINRSVRTSYQSMAILKVRRFICPPPGLGADGGAQDYEAPSQALARTSVVGMARTALSPTEMRYKIVKFISKGHNETMPHNAKSWIAANGGIDFALIAI
ncbi:hypothetical protein PoB_003639500 [Plakobranchus ocellatus]|uniref:Uncharacterized protein n=1 Tax=Plakobranchus ocellatus TaxID=259542 RepID=A0AAV4ARE8_9GAST|nr:hypothetical protein PoB_003639500 [Plakobranchus ocellatus]